MEKRITVVGLGPGDAALLPPMADYAEARREYGIELCGLEELRDLDAVILAVAHQQYESIGFAELRGRFRKGAAPLLLDVKGRFAPAEAEAAGFTLWRL